MALIGGILLVFVLVLTRSQLAVAGQQALPVPIPAPGNWQPGQPVSGQPATLRVVALRSLPPMSPSSNRSGVVLPFHPQRPNPNANFSAPVIDPRSYFVPAVVTPTIVASFDGIDSEESGGAGGPCYCVPPDGDM